MLRILGVVALTGLLPWASDVARAAAVEDEESDTIAVARRGEHGVDIDLGKHGKIRIDDDGGQGDIVLMGDDIFVDEDEEVEGDAVAIGGSITVLGKVRGNAVAVGGSIQLGDSAYVGGDAVSIGGGINKSESARVKGETIQVGVDFPSLFFKPPRPRRAGSFGSSLVGFFRLLVLYLVGFAFAAVAIYLLRGRIGYASEYLSREPVPSFLLGLMSPVLFFIAFILLCITVIGLFVAIPMLFLSPVFIFLGWVVTGHRIGTAVGQGNRQVTVRTVLIGLLILNGLHIMAELIKLVGIGGFPNFFIMLVAFMVSITGALVGLGAILGTRFRLPPALSPAPATPAGTVPGAPPFAAPAAAGGAGIVQGEPPPAPPSSPEGPAAVS